MQFKMHFLTSALATLLLTAALPSTALPRSPTLDVAVCQPTRYVVLDDSSVELYKQEVHGTAITMRTFELMPRSNCYDLYTKALLAPEWSELTISEVTSLSVLAERGILSWASSKLFWKITASVAGAVGSAVSLASCAWDLWKDGVTTGKVACVVGAGLTLLGSVYPLWTSIAKSLETANTAASYVLTTYDNSLDWSSSTEASFFASRNGLLQNATTGLNTTARRSIDAVPDDLALYHVSNDKPVHGLDVLRANQSHPINIYHVGRYSTATGGRPVTVWSEFVNATNTVRIHTSIPFRNSTQSTSKKRGSVSDCAGPGYDWEEIDAGQLEDCYPVDGAPVPNEHSALYYGWDLYGTQSAINEFNDDMGTTFDQSNDFLTSGQAMMTQYYNDNAWEMCVCQQANNNWVATGAMQFTWNNGPFNGYS